MNITVAYMTVTIYNRSALQLTSCCIAILIKPSIDSLLLHVTKTKISQHYLHNLSIIIPLVPAECSVACLHQWSQ